MDYNKILDDAKKLLELTKSNTEDKEEFEKKMQERFNTDFRGEGWISSKKAEKVVATFLSK